MKPSRIAAVVIVIAAAAWIGTGVIGKADRAPGEAPPAATSEERVSAPFKVGVVEAKVEPHAPSLVVSGRTEADKRASAIARASGVIVSLKARRGTTVKKGDVIAVLSDEARTAQLEQAKARLEQRKTELEARLKLIEKGVYPELNRTGLEAELRAAQAGLAQAQAELEKGSVTAPIAGVVNSVPVETGQALQPGETLAQIIALDPMLAVIEVNERQLSGVQVGTPAEVELVTGGTAIGIVRFVSRSASPQTRTYRVDIELENADGRIPDGVTCSVSLQLAARDAAHLPRSALTFTTSGELAVRTVRADGMVDAVPVTIVEDALEHVWVAGVPDGTRVIVRGQDFVKEGERVEAVPLSRG